jgi:hypothetical protein
MPIQTAMEIIHIVFVFIEAIFGFVALKTLARFQVSRFHYKQFDTAKPNEDREDGEFDWIKSMKIDSPFKMKTVRRII